MNQEQQKKILERVSEWLDLIGKSREWLAEQIGVSVGTVNGWYSPGSKRPIPKPNIKLMEHLIQDNELGDPKFTFPETLVIQRAMKAADYISFPEFAHDAVIAKANAILQHEAFNSTPELKVAEGTLSDYADAPRHATTYPAKKS
jgi:hypothetical protein